MTNTGEKSRSGSVLPVHVSHRTGSGWHSYDASLEPYGHDYALLRLDDGQEIIFDIAQLAMRVRNLILLRDSWENGGVDDEDEDHFYDSEWQHE